MIEARLIAALALLAGLWFGWHRLTESYREQGRQECRTAALTEYRENSDEIARIAARARADSARLSADAGAARSAADRLRGAVAGSGLTFNATASFRGSSDPDAELLLAELQRQRGVLADRVADLSGFADKRSSEQATCQASYSAVEK